MIGQTFTFWGLYWSILRRIYAPLKVKSPTTTDQEPFSASSQFFFLEARPLFPSWRYRYCTVSTKKKERVSVFWRKITPIILFQICATHVCCVRHPASGAVVVVVVQISPYWTTCVCAAKTSLANYATSNQSARTNCRIFSTYQFLREWDDVTRWLLTVCYNRF